MISCRAPFGDGPQQPLSTRLFQLLAVNIFILYLVGSRRTSKFVAFASASSMKLFSFLTLLCSSTALASGLDLAPREPKCPKQDGQTDDQIIAKYKTTGQCFSYTGAGNRDKSLAPCSGPDGYCQKVKKSTSGVEGVSQCLTVLNSMPSARVGRQ